MAEGEAPLISVDCTLAFLTDVNGFVDPSREAVRFPVNDGSIRKEGQRAVNRDEGSFTLNHSYNRFLDTKFLQRVKNRKYWVPASSDEGLW